MILNSFTARCARDAEIAEAWNFSFAVERTAKENHSTAYLQKVKIEEIFYQGPEDLRVLAFRRLSEKLKNKNLCALSVSAVIK